LIPKTEIKGVSRSPTAASPNSHSQLDYNFRMQKPPGRDKDRLLAFARYSEIGFIIPVSVLLGLFLGKLADYWLHTKWLYLVGLLFGAVVGFWQVIRMALGAFNNNEDE
jgi:hypothetical protein